MEMLLHVKMLPPVGNINKNSIDEILVSDEMKKQKNQLKTKNVIVPTTVRF